MTLHQLAVEPRDVAADALGLLLDAPAPPTLAEVQLDDGRGGSLTLGVLAASHVVTATRPGSRLTEQVSCDARAAGGRQLPQRLELTTYRMSSRTRALPARRLQTLAGRLREQARQDGWICGAFPGADAALTVMTGSPLAGRAPAGDGWHWQTWHLYPADEGGVVVETASRWRP